MKITEIRLNNWCQYEGEHVLQLGADRVKNVVLIHGDNDVGKTSLFYSIAWCLHEVQPEKWLKNEWPLYPLPSFMRARVGEEIKTEVSLTFEHAGTTYSAHRSFVTQKTKTGHVETDRHFVFMRRDPLGNWSQDSEDKLHRILPRSVLGYFIFDAEEVEHFAVQSDKVRQSVLRLLDIEDGERAIRHLQSVSQDLRRMFESRKSNQAILLGQEISGLENKVTALQKELEDPTNGLGAKLDQSRKQRREVEELLFQYKAAHDLLEEEKQLLEDLSKNSQEQVAIRKKIKSLTQKLYLGLALGTTQWVLNYLEDKRKKGELPKHVKRQFVEDRLHIGECICGTALVPGSEAHKKILAFRETLSDTLGDLSQQLNNNLVRLIEKARSNKTQIADHLARLAEFAAAETEAQEKLRAVRAKIQQRHDIPEVPQLQIKKEELESQEQALVRKIALTEQLIKDERLRLEGLHKDYEAELRKEKEGSEAEEMWRLATRAQDSLTHAIEAFKARARAYLEAQTNLVGEQLFWREGVYTIEIDDDYVLSVRSPEYGEQNLLAGMSMGATQMTGLALIAALARQTRAQAPLIMDTPFARLGPAHITRALAECPKHFQQWILFLQPSEWRDSEYRRVVGDKIQKEYTLQRDNKTGVTTLVEGYHKEFFGRVVEG